MVAMVTAGSEHLKPTEQNHAISWFLFSFKQKDQKNLEDQNQEDLRNQYQDQKNLEDLEDQDQEAHHATVTLIPSGPD